MENKFTILLTRPRAQNAGLQAQLMKLAWPYFIFPLLEIEKIAPISQATHYDLMIFTSVNAVNLYEGEIKVPVFAIGSGTQAALKKKNIHAFIPSEFTSEGVLALPALQNVQQKKIAIVCGENPRLLLSDSLIARGATVDMIFVYRRSLPQPTAAEINKLVTEDRLLIMVSSAESLGNLIYLFAEHLAWLFRQRLLVTSQNLNVKALQLGFKQNCLVAANASDEAVMDILRQLK